jgi:hypothetical protein
MSRYLDRDEPEQSRQEDPQSRMRLSQGHGGGAASNEATDVRRRRENSRTGDSPLAKSRAELARIIDEVAATGRRCRRSSTGSISGACKRSVAFSPSGRLNGMCYRVAGYFENGSTPGRVYTAHGLQQRKRVQYDTARVDSALLRVVNRAGMRRPDRVENARDQSGRHRNPESGLSADKRTVLAEVGQVPKRYAWMT